MIMDNAPLDAINHYFKKMMEGTYIAKVHVLQLPQIKIICYKMGIVKIVVLVITYLRIRMDTLCVRAFLRSLRLG